MPNSRLRSKTPARFATSRARTSESARAGLEARLPRAAGMFARSAEWWKSRSPRIRRSGGAARDRSASPSSSSAARSRGMRSTAITRSGREVFRRRQGGRRRGARQSLEAEIALWRYLLDIEWAGAVSARLLPLDHSALVDSRPAAAKEDAGRRRALGSASSTWAPRCRRSYSPHGPVALRCRTISAPGTPDAGSSRAVREEDALGGRSRLRRLRARFHLSRRVHLRASLVRGGRWKN